MPMSPKYWQKAKYEMLARLDNLGAFQFFFTLSCAEMRWEPCFASVLKDRGYIIRYEVEVIDGHWKQVLSVRIKKDKWKPLQEFIKEDLKESYHQIIRGNVNTATRYFDKRVKNFFHSIVLSQSNPMKVKYFTYKVEFQARGAGHVHGTLWLDLFKIEQMAYRNGKPSLQGGEEEDIDKPFLGITAAFKKLRNDLTLAKNDIECLTRFADEFVTVTTDPNTVGEDVARIAQEVNTHNHTKTCRKYSSECRFNYPKYPSPETLIARPIRETGKEREKKIKEINTIMVKVKEVMLDDELIEEILEEVPKISKDFKTDRKKRISLLLNKAGVNLEDYMEALQFSKIGYSIVLQRDIDELKE